MNDRKEITKTMTKAITLEGVYPILATPFTDTGKLDEESLTELVRFQLAANVNGIALFGNASEMYTLLEEERDRVTEIVTKEVNGRVPLVFGTGHTGVEGAIQLSKKAEAAGADALMILPPYMVKPDAPRLYDYFAAVAQAVSIPIMLQDAPIASGVNIPVDVMIKLAADFDNISYVKVEAPPTTVKITEILEKSNGNLRVFGGLNGMYLIEELERGAVGTMPACEFPDLCRKIFEYYRSGNVETARKTFYRLLPFIRIGTMPKYAMSVHKEVLKAGGIIRSAYVRNPNVPIDDQIQREVFHTLHDLDLLALNWKKSTSAREL